MSTSTVAGPLTTARETDPFPDRASSRAVLVRVPSSFVRSRSPRVTARLVGDRTDLSRQMGPSLERQPEGLKALLTPLCVHHQRHEHAVARALDAL